jgi:hypothetical protein
MHLPQRKVAGPKTLLFWGFSLQWERQCCSVDWQLHWTAKRARRWVVEMGFLLGAMYTGMYFI